MNARVKQELVLLRVYVGVVIMLLAHVVKLS
jgi:hypothetical protein